MMSRNHPEKSRGTGLGIQGITGCINEKPSAIAEGFKLPDELEIRIGVGEGILHEILLKIGVPLLVMGHGRVAEMVEIDVFHSVRKGIGEPFIDQSGTGLDRLCIWSGERHEMGAGVSAVIQHSQTGDYFAFVARDVALYVIRRDCRHGTVILDVILLVQVFYRSVSESLHELEIRNFRDFRSGS